MAGPACLRHLLEGADEDEHPGGYAAVSTPKKIKLADWASRHFDPVPSAFVLRKLAREGGIYPQPIKVGRDWYVAANARLLADEEPVGGGLVAQLLGQRAA